VVDEGRPEGDSAHGRHGGEEHASRPQDAVSVSDRGSNVVDQLERLCDEEAVEEIGGYLISGAEIGKDRDSRIGRVDVHDITALDGRTVAVSISTLFDLQDATADVTSMLEEKSLDVITVDWSAAVEPPVIADGPGASDSAEAGGCKNAPKPLQG